MYKRDETLNNLKEIDNAFLLILSLFERRKVFFTENCLLRDKRNIIKNQELIEVLLKYNIITEDILDEFKEKVLPAEGTLYIDEDKLIQYINSCDNFYKNFYSPRVILYWHALLIVENKTYRELVLDYCEENRNDKACEYLKKTMHLNSDAKGINLDSGHYSSYIFKIRKNNQYELLETLIEDINGICTDDTTLILVNKIAEILNIKH